MHRSILINDTPIDDNGMAAGPSGQPEPEKITLQPASGALKGEVAVPGDKSISHRAIMLSSIAKGDTVIEHFLNSADCRATIDCFGRLGIYIEEDFEHPGVLTVHGTGLHGLYPSHSPIALYTQNSGTTTRILTGILAPQPFVSYLSGDDSINRRPMKRVMEPLNEMGGSVESLNNNDCAPLKITGKPLHGIEYHTKTASAQVKSAILCAGLYAEGNTTVVEPAVSRDHTERMLKAFGADLDITDLYDTIQPEPDPIADLLNIMSNTQRYSGMNHPPRRIFKGHSVTVHPAEELRSPGRIVIPGDISSAAFFIAAGSIVPGSEILIRNVGMNKTRDGILRIAQDMGADIAIQNLAADAEPHADILVKASALHGTTIEGAIIPTLIDELPVIAVMAAAASGTTTIHDAAELKVKESDRIAAMTEGLAAMGADITSTEDGWIIHGGKPLHGAAVRTFGDHRVAMSLAVASLLADGETTLDDAGCIDISYPDFFTDLDKLKS